VIRMSDGDDEQSIAQPESKGPVQDEADYGKPSTPQRSSIIKANDTKE